MTVRPTPNHLIKDSVPSRVLEVLELDGGWLTRDGIALVITDVTHDTLRRALIRLRSYGMIESRIINLATGSGGRGKRNAGVETRYEWKATTSGRRRPHGR